MSELFFLDERRRRFCDYKYLDFGRFLSSSSARTRKFGSFLFFCIPSGSLSLPHHGQFWGLLNGACRGTKLGKGDISNSLVMRAT